MFDDVARPNAALEGRHTIERQVGRRRPRVLSLGVVALGVALPLCWSCVGGATDPADDTGAREAFIGVYLDLRTTALTSGTTDLGDEVRDSILAEHGLTGQGMLDFVEAHGEDVEFMRDLWSELEIRMNERLEQIARDEEAEEPEVEQRGAGNAGVSP